MEISDTCQSVEAGSERKQGRTVEVDQFDSRDEYSSVLSPVRGNCCHAFAIFSNETNFQTVEIFEPCVRNVGPRKFEIRNIILYKTFPKYGI